MQCRACLINATNMILFNEDYITGLNMVTGLNICSEDNMPQHLCERCYRDLLISIKFRDKCVASNAILTETVIELSDIKQESSENNYHTIKEKHNIHVASESENNYINEYEDTNLLVIDNKNTSSNEYSRRKKSNRKKKVTLEQNVEVQLNQNSIDYDCGICTVKIDKENLLDHLESHRKSNYCNICSEYFREWPILLVHRVTHLAKTQLACHLCFAKFPRPTSLEYHYINKHLSNFKTLFTKCFECNKSYGSLELLKKHRWGVHSKRTFQCNDCSKAFKIKQLLKNHITGAHTNAKKLCCHLCSYSSYYKTNLKDHKKRKHISERVYCQLCKRVFGNVRILEQHLETCRKDPTICPVCGKLLKVNQNLNRHLQTHSAVGQYKCDRCPSTYKSKSALNEHTNKHDGIRNKKCDYCPAAFYSSSVLNKHRRVHTGIKPYVCKVCQKAFTGNNNLKVHMRVHGQDLIEKKHKRADTAADESLLKRQPL